MKNTAIRLGMLVMIATIFSCKPKSSNVIATLARNYLDKIGDTTATVQTKVVEDITQHNTDDWIEKIIDNLALIHLPDSGGFTVLHFRDLPDFSNKRNAWLAEFRQRSLIREGDRAIEVTWALSAGESFTTYGIEQPDGRVRFESVLHFAIDEVVSVPVRAAPGSLVIQNKELYVLNGYGVKVAHGKWDVMIDYSNCKIVGPPAKVINTLCNEAFIWSAACNDGSAIYQRPKEGCPGNTEDCLQWVIELGFTRLDNVSVDLTVAGTYRGITLRGTIHADDIGWGGVLRDHGILCARSGDLLEENSTSYSTGAHQADYSACLEAYVKCTDMGSPCTDNDPRWGESNCANCFKRCKAGKSLPGICSDCGFN